MSIRTYQDAPLDWCWRGPKFDRLKALEKIECKRRSKVFRDTAYIPNTIHVPQLSTRAHHTGPAPFNARLQGGPRPLVPHNPPSIPAGSIQDGPKSSNDSPVSFHVPLGSGLRTASGMWDNHALLRQTQHLDDHTSAWNRRRNNQAIQWKSVTIPQLIPRYLANRAATQSGRSPPSPKLNHQCECNKVALKVKMVTWDRKFSRSTFPAIVC